MSTSRAPKRTPAFATGARRRARERALELLYEAELKGLAADAVLAALPVAPEPFAVELFTGAMARAHEIDALVTDTARTWAVERMPVVDRQLLRLATYELLAEPGVPCAVVIDEAIELAKAYSTEESGRFVNGVLAALGRRLRPDESPPAEVARGG